MALVSPKQVEEFYTQGFTYIPQVFTPEEMDAIDAATESLHRMAEEVALQPRTGDSVEYKGSRITYGKGNNFVRHIAYCGNAEPSMRKFGRDPRILEIAATILESKEFDHMINQVHYKRPGSAVAFDWHQDIAHRGYQTGGFKDVDGRGSYVQILLAIDDSTPENGPLEFIPGSNKLGYLGDNLTSKVDISTRVAPQLKRGDIVAFGPYTIHGSEANLSNKSRRVFINGFAYPGANQRTFNLPHVGDRLSFSN
jgi:ectoine hydroxylase-related dioxygenase (phytanoyl-CoA dioxygenase family)